jgi:micrococcal nuclease
MKDFFEKNKIPIAIIIAGFIIAGSIWLSNSSAAIRQQSPSDRKLTAQQPSKTEEQIQQPVLRIDYAEAPEHVGEYACVTGRVDHVYTSKKGTIFINFCSDYKTCSFGAVIFETNSYKFPKPKQYEKQAVEITGLIRTYQGRAEIVLNDPNQIKIKSDETKPVKETSALSRVVEVIDGDTIKVDIAGTVETVRLIGIDAPEIAGPNHLQPDYFGPEAAQYARKLMEKQSVYLIPDPMNSNRDKYGRLLRYVFLEDGTLVNAKLVEQGFAFNYMYEPFQFMKQFDYLEKQAKENRLGLWAGETK